MLLSPPWSGGGFAPEECCSAGPAPGCRACDPPAPVPARVLRSHVLRGLRGSRGQGPPKHTLLNSDPPGQRLWVAGAELLGGFGIANFLLSSQSGHVQPMEMLLMKLCKAQGSSSLQGLLELTCPRHLLSLSLEQIRRFLDFPPRLLPSKWHGLGMFSHLGTLRGSFPAGRPQGCS